MKDQELIDMGIKVVTPDHKEWEERRQRWNKFSEDEAEAPVRIIVVPQNTDDVVKIVNWARKYQQTDIGVRSGGHGFFSAAAVVVDMREGFGFASVDDETGIATIGMGNALGEVDGITDPWHCPLGVVSHTGCGLLFTGGVGYQTKMHGTAADNILEVTIVTSDGEIHVCSQDKEPDLFFAVRGAAPNLGIVTECKARCYKHPTAFCTLRAWPNTYENVKMLKDWADQDAVLHDPTITPYFAMIPAPDLSAHLCAIHIVCIGDESHDDKYKELIGQLEGTEGDTPLLPSGRVPFSTPQTIFDASMGRQYWYVSQNHYPTDKTLDDEGLKAAVHKYNSIQLGPTVPMVIFEQRGSLSSSKYHAFTSDSCAQPRYGQRWECYVFFGCAEKSDAEVMRENGRAMKKVIQSYANEGGRCHFTKDENGARLETFYGPNTTKLRSIVAKYDPIQLFSKCNGMEFASSPEAGKQASTTNVVDIVIQDKVKSAETSA